MVKKLRRVRGKARGELSDHSGYIHCPHSKLRYLVNPHVCKRNHFFWDREVLGIKGHIIAFYEQHCRKCRVWTVALPIEERDLTPKHRRFRFLAPAQKHKRVRRPFKPQVVIEKRVRKRSPKDALAKTPRKRHRREVVN